MRSGVGGFRRIGIAGTSGVVGRLTVNEVCREGQA
jgi:hypothetical protein